MLELNRREPSILACVVNVPGTRQRIVRQQIRSRFIFLNELRVVDAAFTLLERGFERDVVLRRNVKRLTEVKLIQSSGCGPKLRRRNHGSTRERRNKLHRNVLDSVSVVKKR